MDASTFDEALSIVGSDEVFDLVLIDLQMPGWRGFNGLEELCAAVTDTAVIVVSASGSHPTSAARWMPGREVIPKSSSVKIMLSAIILVFSGGIHSAVSHSC